MNIFSGLLFWFSVLIPPCAAVINIHSDLMVYTFYTKTKRQQKRIMETLGSGNRVFINSRFGVNVNRLQRRIYLKVTLLLLVYGLASLYLIDNGLQHNNSENLFTGAGLAAIVVLMLAFAYWSVRRTIILPK